MEMFLMVAAISLFALGVTCAAFQAAMKPEQPELPKPECEPKPLTAPRRFFAEGVTPPVAGVGRPRVPIEVLLAQIENHVRLEQAAAECFLEAPGAVLLHSKTISPFVN